MRKIFIGLLISLLAGAIMVFGFVIIINLTISKCITINNSHVESGINQIKIAGETGSKKEVSSNYRKSNIKDVMTRLFKKRNDQEELWQNGFQNSVRKKDTGCFSYASFLLLHPDIYNKLPNINN